jgi:dTDP-4-amino-4,6-dideoxygalactose transaminase
MPKFPFFDMTRQYKELKSEIMPVIEKIFDKQGFIGGEEVVGFEKEMAEYLGVKHAISCADGTDALVLALKALDVGHGDEVITPAYSFFASTGAILVAGAKPVFVDIEKDSFNIDPKQIEAKITKKNKSDHARSSLRPMC